MSVIIVTVSGRPYLMASADRHIFKVWKATYYASSILSSSASCWHYSLASVSAPFTRARSSQTRLYPSRAKHQRPSKKRRIDSTNSNFAHTKNRHSHTVGTFPLLHSSAQSYYSSQVFSWSGSRKLSPTAYCSGDCSHYSIASSAALRPKTIK